MAPGMSSRPGSPTAKGRGPSQSTRTIIYFQRSTSAIYHWQKYTPGCGPPCPRIGSRSPTHPAVRDSRLPDRHQDRAQGAGAVYAGTCGNRPRGGRARWSGPMRANYNTTEDVCHFGEHRSQPGKGREAWRTGPAELGIPTGTQDSTAGVRRGTSAGTANNPSPACPDGLGDEEAIRAVWAAASARPGKSPSTP